MGTGAVVTIYNQTNSPLTVSLSNVSCMLEDGVQGSQLQLFNNLTVPTYSSSPGTYIETDSESFGCWFSQSAFTLHYLNGAVAMNLGSGLLYNTMVTSNSNPAQCQAVLAANMPFSEGPSYTFYLYGGSGFLAPLLNSVINANVTALQQAVAKSPLTFSYEDTSITVDGFSYSTLTCPYAAVVPDGQNLTFSIILEVSGSVSGSVTIGGTSSPMQAGVTDLDTLIEGKLDLSGATPKITVTRLASYLGDYTVNSSLMALLLTNPVFAVIAAAATPPNLIGVFNASPLNQTIIQAINQALGKL